MGEPQRRITSLDGVRGVAALVVLVHHSLLTIPALANGYYADGATGWLPVLLTYTPLHAFWAGGEAVFVFFVLSGFVLTRPALARPVKWRVYYPSRLLRLYLPVAASIVLALILATLVPRATSGGDSAWMEQHIGAVTPVSVLRNVTLLSPDWLNSPLWSLRWEVAFSVLLPVYVFVAARAARAWWAVAAVAIAASTAGSALDQQWLTYLPMFLLGSALAAGWDQLQRIPSHMWTPIGILGLIGLTARWWIAPTSPGAATFTLPIVLLSAVAIAAAAHYSQAGRTALDLPFAQWSGRMSFSLYLVHEPILVSAALLLPAGAMWATPLVGIPVALLAAWLFARSVEMPSHRLAKWIGRMVAGARHPSRDEIDAARLASRVRPPIAKGRAH